MTALRILVTGSRTFDDADTLGDALYEVIGGSKASHIVIVHGACPRGADRLAAEFCESEAAWFEPTPQSLTEERHPADWKRFGRAAGHVRNVEMVKAGADVCLAFVDWCDDQRCPDRGRHGSHGAVGCAERAEQAGIPVRPFGIERGRWTA